MEGNEQICPHISLFSREEFRGKLRLEKAVLMILGKHGSYREVADLFGVSHSKIYRAVQAVLEGRPIGKAGRPQHFIEEQIGEFFQLMRDHDGEKRINYEAMQEQVK